ncbi:alpha-glucosidase [Archangium sp.]|uniref:alpha-glucosidase n=1 Tax=Archangium sp. TaxID=1872627 RepID=UPI002D6B2393|nr:alpha-glucosidase [Archangium sp.]HYO58833.1 alpha-glucosidase [Archangium sp.]
MLAYADPVRISTRSSRLLPVCLLLLLCAACASNDLAPGRLSAEGVDIPLSSPTGAFEVHWTGGEEPALRIQQGGRTIWESIPGRAFVTAGRGTEEVHESRGLFSVEDSLEERCVDQSVTSIVIRDRETVELRGTLSCRKGEVGYGLRLTPVSGRQLAFTLEVEDPRYNRVALTQASTKDEGVYGFGEQFSWFDHKGLRVPIVVSEQGIGRGAFPITLGADLTAGAGGDGHTTYAAVPHFLTSRLRSLFLEDTEVSFFDLRDDGRITVELFSSTMRGRIVAGTTPLELIEEYTAHAGRMRRLPDWILGGAVIGMQGGTERVREVLGALEEKEVPVAAFWLQDWVGQRTTSFGKQLWWNWELDPERYPGWPELVGMLEARGIRVMTYVNPFLADVEGQKPAYRRNLFAEAKERSYLVRTPGDAPYLIQNTSFSAGLVDLTNPEARRWMKDVLRDEVLAVGASGWMADFGEALPYDARLAGGDAKPWHNAYPEEWARLNRELIEEVGRGEDGVFFMRSGFTRSPRYSTLFWLGDQLVSWDDSDGIKSAVTGLLSGGLSGFSLNHGDIGGYTTIDNPLQNYHRSPELLKRWTELAAFTPVFRTHEGNIPDRNAQVYSDDDSLTHFARMAKVYRAWAPYRRQLVDEAAARGYPVVRHLFLHYPEDTTARRLRYEEFLVGSELLVVPVLDAGVEKVRVYLPAGRWVHVWSDQEYGDEHGGRWVTVAAPMGRPAVFHKQGSEAGDAFRARLLEDGLR